MGLKLSRLSDNATCTLHRDDVKLRIASLDNGKKNGISWHRTKPWHLQSRKDRIAHYQFQAIMI